MGIKRIIKKVVPKSILVILKNTKMSIKKKKTAYYIKKINRRNRDSSETIKVCFLVQMSEIWDKQIMLYEKLNSDSRFSVDLVVVPPFDFLNKKIGTHYTDDYFFRTYPNAIKAYENDKWFDLKNKRYDYVFYQRPYNGYLPRKYRNTIVAKYSKCCYIPYALWPLNNNLCGYNDDFFCALYFAFMDSKENVEELSGIHNTNDRIIFCGYPLLENLDRVEYYNCKQVLWTPRWSYDQFIGGSHFFEYKDGIVDYCAERKFNLTIRPHQLAFDNYLAEGLITENELQAFKDKVYRTGAKFDTNKVIEDTFAKTGILISDVSSIIFPFFATAKPVIYCKSAVPTSPSFNALLDGMYVANSQEDIFHYLDQLSNGIDPLKNKREFLAQRLINDNRNATKKIIDKLIEDLC